MSKLCSFAENTPCRITGGYAQKKKSCKYYMIGMIIINHVVSREKECRALDSCSVY